MAELPCAVGGFQGEIVNAIGQVRVIRFRGKVIDEVSGAAQLGRPATLGQLAGDAAEAAVKIGDGTFDRALLGRDMLPRRRAEGEGPLGGPILEGILDLVIVDAVEDVAARIGRIGDESMPGIGNRAAHYLRRRPKAKPWCRGRGRKW